MPEMGRWLYLLGLAFLVTRATAAKGDGAKKDPRNEEPKTIMAAMQPGKLGIGAEWNSGRVTSIEKGGQGETNKIRVGDLITKIDGKNYHESLLDKRVAGKNPYEMTLLRFPTTTTTTAKPAEPELPPVPDFKYATVLTPDTFKSMVYGVANGTNAKKTPPYYPVVMFHMSWCKHCRHALPEYEQAAQMVHDMEKSGQRPYPVYPKLFLLECDKPPEHKPLCEMYVGSNYPVIKLFRDHRSVHFNRPRMAQTFAWWAMHVARPPIIELQSKEAFEGQAQHRPVFVLHADLDQKENKEAFENWQSVALDNIEEHTLAYVKPGTEVSKLLLPAPSINVKGEGLDPVPFEGAMTKENLAEWVMFNQFTTVTELSPYSDSGLRKSGYVVIVLVYNSEDSKSKAKGQFEFKAKQLRKHRQFIFATLDSSKQDNKDYLIHEFPLLSEKLVAPPRVFAMEGKETYWESPSWVGNDASQLTMESIGELLADSEARQDKNTMGWVKERRKIIFRFASGSTFGLAVTILLPIIIVAFLRFCVKALFSSDEPPAAKEEAKKVD